MYHLIARFCTASSKPSNSVYFLHSSGFSLKLVEWQIQIFMFTRFDPTVSEPKEKLSFMLPLFQDSTWLKNCLYCVLEMLLITILF